MAKVNFRTNILLKSIIGKDLITDDSIAVLELVKNSFDAGSKTSYVIFRDLLHNQLTKDYKKENDSKIILRDLGAGMSEFDLVNKWLNIAYSEKKAKKEEHNRQLAGNKGVGRFSCDRLGKSLVIYTRKRNEPLLKLSIDWTSFERIDDINKNIQDVEFELIEIDDQQYVAETGLKKFKTGTTLFISNLREEWDFSKLQTLKRQLERFINPNQNFEAETFDVIIKAEEFIELEQDLPDDQKINGTVKNRIFSNLDFRTTNINAHISDDGKTITTTLKDRGNEIFTLIENNPFNLLKDVHINIYYLNPYSKAYFTKQTGIRSVDFGSIFLFINGFRIPPYGDEGNDWLGMEIRKGQGHSRFLGTREVIGRIEINGVEFDEEEDDFFIISNRSGVDNNKHFEQLTKNEAPFGFYYKTFRRLERFVVEGIKWDSSTLKDSEVQRKVLNDKNWNESKEEFREDSLTRNKRVISIIEKIINVKGEDIISLSINRDLVSELAEEQAEKSKREIDSIVKDLEDKELSSQQINSLINKLAASEEDVSTFPIQDGEIERLKSEQEKLRSELLDRFKHTKQLEDEAKRLEEEARKLQEELELEKEKNTYLRTSSRSLSEDAKGLVHNIKLTSKKINSSVDNLYDKILNGDPKKSEILKALSIIKFQAEKALKVSKIITRSNFNADKNEQFIDLVKYVSQYIEIYSDIYEDTGLEFSLKYSSNPELNKKVSVLDISLILDDLISNAEKAGADKVLIEMDNPSKNELRILFSDDGKGLDSKFLGDPEKVFELGITTTDGSGIGLNSVRTALKAIKGTITFKGNNLALKGACFEIRITG